MADVLLIGCGDWALPLGRAFLAAECGAAATTIDPAFAKVLADAGLAPVDADADMPETLDGVADGFDIVCLRPGRDPVEAARAVLQGLPFELHRFILLSDIEVYGRAEGSVDETAEPCPQDDHARALAAAEKMCLGAYRTQAVPTVVLRVGQVVTADQQGTAGADSIHIDDLCRAVVAAADRNAAGQVFNVVAGPSGRISSAKLAAELGVNPRPGSY